MTRSKILRHGWVPAALLAVAALLALTPTGGNSASAPSPKRPAPTGVSATEPCPLPAPVASADPGDLRPVLQHSLTRFSSLETYRYTTQVRIYDNGTLVHETRSRGHVKNPDLVVARTHVNGEVFDVVTRGGETRVRRPGENWSEYGGGWIEETNLDPRAANFVEALSDPGLAARPLVPAGEEIVEGLRCTALKLTLLGEDGGFGTTVTFAVDADRRLRLWKLESEVSNNGRTVKTVAESTFGDFNAPWTIHVPEWSK